MVSSMSESIFNVLEQYALDKGESPIIVHDKTKHLKATHYSVSKLTTDKDSHFASTKEIVQATKKAWESREMDPLFEARLQSDQPLHSRVTRVYVGLELLSKQAKLQGWRRFLGLFQRIVNYARKEGFITNEQLIQRTAANIFEQIQKEMTEEQIATLIQRAMELNTENPRVLFCMAKRYADTGQVDLAIQTYESLAKKGKEVRKNVANELHKAGNRNFGASKNPEHAFQYHLAAAELGDEESMYEVLKFYINGAKGVIPPNRTEAQKWFENLKKTNYFLPDNTENRQLKRELEQCVGESNWTDENSPRKKIESQKE